MKIKLALSNYWTNGKIPQERKDLWQQFNGSFKNKEIDTDLFPVMVNQGFAYTAQHTNYRKAVNFTCTQFLAVDYDKGMCSFETLLRNDFIRQWAHFLHTTPSHTAKQPRTRVVFVLDGAVDDSELYGEMATAITDYFELSDNSTKDAARFFYGSKGCEILKLGNILPIAVFNELILEPYRIKEERKIKEELKRLNNIKIVQVDNVPDRLLEIHRAKLLNHISTASDGKKHLTILQICKTLGGYIGGGYYNYSEIVDYCKSAIIANPNNVKNLDHAFETIETALQYGIKQPLYFENKYSDEINAVEPALSDIQKKQVYTITSRAYQDGHNDLQIEMWKKKGFEPYIAELFQLGYQEQKVDKVTGEILQSEAYIVPFCDNEKNFLNIEYRFEHGGIEYENEYPFLFTTDNERSNCQMVILPDSVTAINTYLNIGVCDYNFVGLPHMRILKETVDFDGAVVLLEPDTVDEYGLSVLRGHCRFMRLNKSMKDLLDAKVKITPVDLGWYIKQAVKK